MQKPFSSEKKNISFFFYLFFKERSMVKRGCSLSGLGAFKQHFFNEIDPEQFAVRLHETFWDLSFTRVVVGHEILGGEFHCEKYERVVRQVAGPETRFLDFIIKLNRFLRVEKSPKPGLVTTMVHVLGDTQALKLVTDQRDEIPVSEYSTTQIPTTK
jgi:hypothetical protein